MQRMPSGIANRDPIFPRVEVNTLKNPIRIASAPSGAKRGGNSPDPQIEMSLIGEGRKFSPWTKLCPRCRLLPWLLTHWDHGRRCYLYSLACDDPKCDFPKPEPNHDREKLLRAWRLSVILSETQ